MRVGTNADQSSDLFMAINGGTIAEPRVYSRALSEAEKKTAYMMVRPGSSYVTINNIAANAITAEKIDVTNLAAINANLGTITAGVMQSSDWGTSAGVEFDLTNKRLRFGGSADPVVDLDGDAETYSFRGTFTADDVTGSAPSSGDTRFVLDKDSLEFQMYNGSSWVARLTMNAVSGEGYVRADVVRPDMLWVESTLSSAPTSSTSGLPGQILAVDTSVNVNDQSMDLYVCTRAQFTVPPVYTWQKIAG